MAGYIIHGEEKSVVLKAADVDKLIRKGNGDAALLWLCLCRADRGVRPAELKDTLSFTDLRLSAAETALEEAGLLQRQAEPMPAMTEPEKPVYTAEDIAQMLEKQERFRLLCDEVDKKLGTKMTTSELKCLAGLYGGLGMPEDVIYLLVSHCVERYQRGEKKGPRPTMRQIEKEGYHWVQLGIFSQEAADRYLCDYARRVEKTQKYMEVLCLGQRMPVAGELRYLTDWSEKGFAPDAVGLAYERTIMKKQKLEWAYLNGILRRWHESGWHTAEQVAAGEIKPGRHQTGEKKPGKNDWMRQYAKR